VTSPTDRGDPAVVTAEPSALEVRDLGKRYGDTRAVDGIGFDLAAHEILCLVGPSGCGKSTVLRMLAGLVTPDVGEVVLAGRTVDGPKAHVAPERRGVGIVFQEHALFPNLTVNANVGFGLAGVGRAARGARVTEMLALVALEAYADRYPHELSGGERQRVALARALAPAPSVLLLDEPFASLDQNLRVQVRDQVVSVLRDTGTPAVFVTHDQGEALALGDRILVLRRGQVAQLGTPQTIFHSPVDRFVAAFMGEADFLPARVVGAVVATELGERPSPDAAPNRSVEMVIRPDDVTFDESPTGSAVVEGVEFQGSSTLYRLRLASGAVVRSRRAHTEVALVGTRVTARFSNHHRPPVLIPASDSPGVRGAAQGPPEAAGVGISTDRSRNAPS